MARDPRRDFIFNFRGEWHDLPQPDYYMRQPCDQASLGRVIFLWKWNSGRPQMEGYYHTDDEIDEFFGGQKKG